MSVTVRTYGCGCCDGPEYFEPCLKASRLEDRMYDAALEVEQCSSNASCLAQYPLTCDDAQYFERGQSIKEQADKLARVAVDLEDLYYREVDARRRANRAHRAISRHITSQTESGAYRDVFLEDPPDPDSDAADL